jgi:hypothetical protein
MHDDAGVGAWEDAVRAHEARLEVGARVRCVPSPECPDFTDRRPRAPADGTYHVQERVGEIGTIALILPASYAHPGHVYLVMTDDGRFDGLYFAAAELIPLDPTDAPPHRAPERG